MNKEIIEYIKQAKDFIKKYKYLFISIKCIKILLLLYAFIIHNS